jgi:tRNA G18 (ribose-2'-O)-methylase SpoU
MIIIVHDIRSLHNVGSIFRNAAAFNIEKLYLTGFTETPPRKEIAKVALGAELLVDWVKAEISQAIDECRTAGYTVLGLETGDEAKDIGVIGVRKIALVLGNEVAGIDVETRRLLDGLVVIPMGKKQSLNVSVASGIAMYVLTKAQ